MAVVQISRIQVRRGQANQGSGIPQLAGGEFGWAVDEQELYIGNGSVAEGAPQVGNSKILTEHDDLFELVGTYSYKRGSIDTGEGISVERTLNSRLDDIVSVRSFGCAGDGSDVTVALPPSPVAPAAPAVNAAAPPSSVPKPAPAISEAAPP